MIIKDYPIVGFPVILYCGCGTAPSLPFHETDSGYT